MTQFYLGQIIQFASNFAIQGTAMCNGQTLSIQQNAALFALVGTFYGGNGTSTFQLPDLRGRTMIHQGTGLGLSTYVIGETGGVEQVSVLQSNLPSHTHTMAATFNASGLQPQATTEAPAAGSVLGHAVDVSTNTAKAKPAIYCPTGTTANVALGGLNVSAGLTGGNIPLQILNPYLAITCLIMTTGIFPSRN
jgi:microcystin-dependent protein